MSVLRLARTALVSLGLAAIMHAASAAALNAASAATFNAASAAAFNAASAIDRACEPDAFACPSTADNTASPSVAPAEPASQALPPLFNIATLARSSDMSRVTTLALSPMQIDAAARGLTAGPVDVVKDAAARAADDVTDMADREVLALVGALLLAVLSLSRRRNL